MNGKENYLNALKHKKTEWIAIEGEDLLYCGFESSGFEKGPRGGGYDGFGVRWVGPESGGGTALPAPNEFILKDITKWQELSFPDLENYHWEADEQELLTGIDRESTIVNYGSGNGHFERLCALMGFEEALLAMLEEPEAVTEFFTKLTDYKIEEAKKAKKYFNPDTYTLYDDVATQRSPFMSPKTYKELISPHHKRLFAAVKELGIIPILHCCGYAEPLLESFIDEGIVAWTSVQPSNDIVGILNKYGDRLCIIGGYDTNGIPGGTDDVEIMRADIKRCFEQYGNCPGYIFSGFIIVPIGPDQEAWEVWNPTYVLCKEAIKYSHEHSNEYPKYFIQ